MNAKKIVRLIMKIFISLISISVALVSILGITSIVNIASDSDNISVDPDSFVFVFGPTGEMIGAEITIKNTGYFDFEDFTVKVNFNFFDNASGENFAVFDGAAWGPEDIKAGATKDIPIAILSLNDELLFTDNGDSWNSSVVDADLIAHPNPQAPTTYAALDQLCMAYFISEYIVTLTLSIEAKYNLGLLGFKVSVPKSLSFDELGTGFSDYATMEAAVLAAIPWV